MKSGDAIAKKPPSSACPCCQIFADGGGNWFLPADVTAAGGADREEGAALPRQPASLPSPSEATENSLRAMVEEPRRAWKLLRQRGRSRLVDTHGHAHLERNDESSSKLYRDDDDDDAPNTEKKHDVSSSRMIRVSCAVERADWDACLAYAAQSPNHVAALGIHPWYLEGLVTTTDDNNEEEEQDSDQWLRQLEERLQQHPRVLVGEIGLCKQARFLRTYAKGKPAALELQRRVFVRQLELAVKYRRPVSIHCVNQQGVLLEIFRQHLCGGQLPPAVALHSFTGTAHHVQQLLKWEAEVLSQKTKKESSSPSKEEASSSSSSTTTPLLYFGFSHTVNYAMCSSDKARRQGLEAVRAVPRDRLLAESDVHAPRDVAVGTAGAIAYMAMALLEDGEDAEDADQVSSMMLTVADLTTRNGLAFLGGLIRDGLTEKEVQ